MKVPQPPEINIGVVGHVDHGKTTLTKTLTGEWTDRHSEEVKRGISIKLGYADAAFYKCEDEEGTKAFTVKPTCPHCGKPTKLLRTVSFVDAPGHETLMATMLTGASPSHRPMRAMSGPMRSTACTPYSAARSLSASRCSARTSV